LTPRQVYEDLLNLKNKGEAESTIQPYENMKREIMGALREKKSANIETIRV